ncbi:MAG: ADP-ribosylglycohydrolase family protein [Saprospiraceae bacterium]
MRNKGNLYLVLGSLALVTLACRQIKVNHVTQDPQLDYLPYTAHNSDAHLSRTEYKEHLEGFWLGECIANWTGLITEMDKIGGSGLDGRGAGFYTRDNWGGPDGPSIWQDEAPERNIDFYLEPPDGIWGADDDTDIEYMYQSLLYQNHTSLLSGEQIREGWLAHIKPEEENYLWVSNQRAFDLMKTGMTPPATGSPENNPDYDMIDAQLTTELFGLLAPGKPDIALQMAYLPIRTTASGQAAMIAEFYVIMHSLAAMAGPEWSMKEKTNWLAGKARMHLDAGGYAAKMYDQVRQWYESGQPWEVTRDSLYEKYQVRQEDGYDWSTREPVCHGCFAAGINFGASLISLFYGEGDLKETIKIGALCGWDSDNPTATWGGLLGFLLGRVGVEEAFGRKLPDQFNIHRTRVGFPDNGIDRFSNMAQKGIFIIDRVVQEQMHGGVDIIKGVWYLPE